MSINWRSFEHASDIQQLLAQHFSGTTTANKILPFAVAEGLECSELVDNVIYCSAPAGSRWSVVRKKWLIKFLFEEQKLVGIEVEQGLIGP